MLCRACLASPAVTRTWAANLRPYDGDHRASAPVPFRRRVASLAEFLPGRPWWYWQRCLPALNPSECPAHGAHAGRHNPSSLHRCQSFAGSHCYVPVTPSAFLLQGDSAAALRPLVRPMMFGYRGLAVGGLVSGARLWREVAPSQAKFNFGPTLRHARLWPRQCHPHTR